MAGICVAGIKSGFEHDRLMYHLRVIAVDGKLQICVRDKAADSIYGMFYTRYDLYVRGVSPVGLVICSLCFFNYVNMLYQ